MLHDQSSPELAPCQSPNHPFAACVATSRHSELPTPDHVPTPATSACYPALPVTHGHRGGAASDHRNSPCDTRRAHAASFPDCDTARHKSSAPQAQKIDGNFMRYSGKRVAMSRDGEDESIRDMIHCYQVFSQRDTRSAGVRLRLRAQPINQQAVLAPPTLCATAKVPPRSQHTASPYCSKVNRHHKSAGPRRLALCSRSASVAQQPGSQTA